MCRNIVRRTKPFGKGRVLSFFIALFFICSIPFIPGSLVSAGSGGYETLDSLGPAHHYNGILFGSYTARQADVEGAVAVGGQLTQLGVLGDGFCFGGAYPPVFAPTAQIHEYENPLGYPTVLLGSDELRFGKEEAAYNVYGGPAVMSDHLYEAYQEGNTRFDPSASGFSGEYSADSALVTRWFHEQYQRVKALGEQFSHANTLIVDYTEFASGAYLNRGPETYRNTQLCGADGNVAENVLVISVRSGPVLNFTNWQNLITINTDWTEAYDMVIYDFPDAEEIRMETSMQIQGSTSYTDPNYPPAFLSARQIAVRENACSRIIWSFPAAKQMHFERYLLWGSVWAPDAAITSNGGSVNGQLAAMHLDQAGGFELHAFRISELVSEFTAGEPGTTAVEVTKYLDEGGNSSTMLPGARFRLFREDGGSWAAFGEAFATGEDGKARVAGLTDGRYRLEEISAPPGFVRDETGTDTATYYRYEFTVGDGSRGEYHLVDADGVLQVSRYNRLMERPLQFFKTGDGGLALANAGFTLIREADHYGSGYEISAVTGTDGMVTFTGLVTGTYRLMESTVPAGYAGMDDIRFTVVPENGDLALQGFDDYTWEDGIIRLSNRLAEHPGGAELFKFDAETGQGLAGAGFKLTRWSPGTEEWETVPGYGQILTGVDGWVRFQGLYDGVYRLVETQPPPGYLQANPLGDGGDAYAAEFTLDAQDPQPVRVELPNTRFRGKITIRKELKASESHTEVFLFRITSGDYRCETAVMVSEGETSADITLSGFPEGEYLIEELPSNWRYEPVGTAEATVALGEETPTAAVCFQNKKTNTHWAGDSAQVTNRMQNKKE